MDHESEINIYTIKNNGTFQTKSDQYNTSKRNKLH